MAAERDPSVSHSFPDSSEKHAWWRVAWIGQLGTTLDSAVSCRLFRVKNDGCSSFKDCRQRGRILVEKSFNPNIGSAARMRENKRRLMRVKRRRLTFLFRCAILLSAFSWMFLASCVSACDRSALQWTRRAASGDDRRAPSQAWDQCGGGAA